MKNSKEGKAGSWMASHIREEHQGVYSKDDLGQDWVASLGGQHQKPLERQVTESIQIRKTKISSLVMVGGKETRVQKEVFNSKEEWYSHTNMWNSVG